jgi:hypothetical protein
VAEVSREWALLVQTIWTKSIAEVYGSLRNSSTRGFRNTPFSLIRGAKMRSRFETLSLASDFDSYPSRLMNVVRSVSKTVTNTYGSTPVISIRIAARNSQKLSTLCLLVQNGRGVLSEARVEGHVAVVGVGCLLWQRCLTYSAINRTIRVQISRNLDGLQVVRCYRSYS